MSDTTSRFGIVVPDPTTRLNMGKPEGGDNAFGYKGISLQASENLFVDITGKTLMQSGSVYQQSGDTWDQYAGGDMKLGCKNNGLWGTSGKITLIAGGGMGMTAQPSTGDAPYFEPYNNLDLHYRVEAVQNTLKQLFFGKGWRALQAKPNAAQVAWAGTGAYAADGLLGEISLLLKELGFEAPIHKELHEQLLQSLEFGGDRLTSNLRPSSDFGPLATFDPYATTAFNTKPWTVGVAMVIQVATFFRRLRDVLAALIVGVTNHEVVWRIKYAIYAINSFNSFIGSLKPDEWKHLGGQVWDSSKSTLESKTSEEYTFADSDTAAELMSLAELYDISSLADDTVLKVVDQKNGGETSIDLAKYKSDQAAVLHLTIGGDFAAVRLAKTADGSVTLDGTTLEWDHAAAKWKKDDDSDADWAEAGYDCDGTLCHKTGGGLFTPTVSDGVTFSDATFDGTKLRVTVDGTAHDVDASAANGSTPEDRAQGLAGALSAVPGITATASGATVTIVTQKKGVDASIDVAATVSEHVLLGLDGQAQGTAGGTMSAGQLAQELSGKGTYTATVVNGAVKLVHDVKGDDSYLKLSGAPAKLTFGDDPSEASGTTATAWDRFAEFDNMVNQIEGWPNAIADMAWPMVKAVKQVGAVVGHIEGVVKNLKGFFLGIAYIEAIGIISGGDGITIATAGAQFTAGKSITQIAMGEASEVDPDITKFTPLLEHALWGVNMLGQKLGDFLKKWLDPDAVPKKAGASGYRIVSASDVHVVARRHTRLVSGETLELYTKTMEVSARDRLRVSARMGGVWLEGRHIHLGNPAGGTAQLPTEAVTMEASTGYLRLITKSWGGWISEARSKIELGSRAAGDVPALDYAKPHLLIDASKIAIGALDGTMRRGVVYDGGDVTVDAKSAITMGAGGKTGMEIKSSGVTISGQLDVGGALMVKGTPVPLAPLVEVAAPNTAMMAKLTALRAKHAAILGVASGLKTAILALDKTIEKAQLALVDIGPLVGPAAWKAATASVKALKAQRATQLKALEKARQEWDEIVSDATDLCASDITSKVDVNRAKFDVKAP